MRVGLLACALFTACSPPAPVGPGESNFGQMICPAGAVTPGLDVSHHDGAIDWARVKAAGKQFAFMKATENVNFVDPMYAANWAGAGQNGIVRGAYHFFRPSVDAVMQADYFVAHAGQPQAGDLPLTLDLEVTDGLSGAAVAQAALAFLQRVEQTTGRTPLVYLSPSFFTSTLGNPAGLGSYLLWIAHWKAPCPDVPDPPWMNWSFWQTDSMGTVNGIAGMNNVDLDEFNGSISDLQAFVNPTGPSTDMAGAGRDAGGAVDGGGLLDGGANPDAARPPGGLSILAQGRSEGCACTIGVRRPAPAPYVLIAIVLAMGAAIRRRYLANQRACRRSPTTRVRCSPRSLRK